MFGSKNINIPKDFEIWSEIRLALYHMSIPSLITFYIIYNENNLHS